MFTTEFMRANNREYVGVEISYTENDYGGRVEVVIKLRDEDYNLNRVVVLETERMIGIDLLTQLKDAAYSGMVDAVERRTSQHDFQVGGKPDCFLVVNEGEDNRNRDTD